MSGWREGHSDKQISGQVQWAIIKKAKVLISRNKYWHNNKFGSSHRTLRPLGMATLIQTFRSSVKSKQSLNFRKILFTKRYRTCLLSWNREKMMHKFRCLTGKTLWYNKRKWKDWERISLSYYRRQRPNCLWLKWKTKSSNRVSNSWIKYAI